MTEFCNEMQEVQIDPTQVMATIVKREDGYHVIDMDGTEGPVCEKCTTDGYLILTPNASNRKCINKKNLDKTFEEGADHVDLFYKATRQVSPAGSKLPNAKLIAYLSEEEQAEYKAIIERARAAKDAAKAKPKTPLDKARERYEKALANYEKVKEECGVSSDDCVSISETDAE